MKKLLKITVISLIALNYIFKKQKFKKKKKKINKMHNRIFIMLNFNNSFFILKILIIKISILQHFLLNDWNLIKIFKKEWIDYINNYNLI